MRDIAESLVCVRRAVQRPNLIDRNNFSNAGVPCQNTSRGGNVGRFLGR
jgi:hypothetical protein